MLIYDTGPLLAAERDNQRVWKLHHAALAAGLRPVVPAVVLAQAWRGGPQHNLSRLLRGCNVTPDDEDLCRAAGRTCGLARSSDVVDALVVVIATRLGAAVVTSDPHDLTHLAGALGLPLTLHTI